MWFRVRPLPRPLQRRTGFQKITVLPCVFAIERDRARNGVSLSRVRWLKRLIS